MQKFLGRIIIALFLVYFLSSYLKHSSFFSLITFSDLSSGIVSLHECMFNISKRLDCIFTGGTYIFISQDRSIPHGLPTQLY